MRPKLKFFLQTEFLYVLGFQLLRSCNNRRFGELLTFTHFLDEFGVVALAFELLESLLDNGLSISPCFDNYFKHIV